MKDGTRKKYFGPTFLCYYGSASPKDPLLATRPRRWLCEVDGSTPEDVLKACRKRCFGGATSRAIGRYGRTATFAVLAAFWPAPNTNNV